MRLHYIWSSLVALIALLLAAPVQATCTQCAATNGQSDLDACFQRLLDAKQGCLDWKASCTPGDTLSIVAPATAAKPFTIKCTGANDTVNVEVSAPDELEKIAAKPVTLKFGANFTTTGKAAAPKVSSNDDDSQGDDSPKEKREALPIDVQPVNGALCIHEVKTPPKNTRYIYVHENLAVDVASAAHVTETDRVVIRFIARKAVLCRYYATSDEDNKYEPQVGRVGGREGLASVLEKSGLVAADGTLESCNIPAGLKNTGTNDDGTQRFEPYGAGTAYDHVDFTFGPFTSEQLTFHVFRHDGGFKGNDLEGEIKVANHQRYVGWFDVAMVGARLQAPAQSIEVTRQNGTELTRLGVREEVYRFDLVAQVKLFLACSGDSNDPFQPQDLQVAAVCFGVGSGLSLTHPTERFYPLGLNLTIARYMSLNVFTMVERTTEIADGYAGGDVFSGSADDVPSRKRLATGLALGIGLDPTLLGEVVGSIIKAGF